MHPVYQEESLPMDRQHGWSLIPDRMFRAGISGYPREVRRRLALTNLTGFLAANSCMCYALVYALYDFYQPSLAVWGNLICAVLYLCLPLWHRLHEYAAPIAFAVIANVSLFFFVATLGTASGIHLNYLGASALSFVLFGPKRYWMHILIAMIGLLLHLVSKERFDHPPAGLLDQVWFYKILYAYSAASIMTLIAAVVWYAFRLAREAEDRSERLLRNILPDKIANRLKASPQEPIADRFDEATVLFADIVGFTPKFMDVPASEMVEILNEVFSRFDQVCSEWKVEKIKTIGDAYMAVSGIPDALDDHAMRMAHVALRMMSEIESVSTTRNLELKLRIGIATGPITAGVIGKAKFAYDVWAPTVNLAARLESHGEVGRIHIADETKRALQETFECRRLAPKDLKGIGRTNVWEIVSQR